MGDAERRKTLRKVGSYVVLVAALTCVAMYLGQQWHLPPRLAFGFVMWMPASSAILVKLVFDGNLEGLGFSPSGGRWLVVALLLPLAYALPVYLPVWLLGVGSFVPERWAGAVPFITSPPGAGVALLLLLTVGLFDKFWRALGEEIGWRGFLVPELLKLMPLGRAGLVSGAIWACWHVPAILFAGYNSGSIPLGYQIACFFVMVISSGVFFAWVRMESGSVWPPALLHASHNLIIQSILDRATANGPLTLYVTGEFGAGLALTSCAVAVLVLTSRRRMPALAHT